jgi:hypothetical protein
MFPNTFIAADGLTYQIIMYTCTVPSVGQRVTLTVADNELEYTVSEVVANDDILITKVAAEDEEAAAPSRAAVVAGKWQIPALQENHTVAFHPIQ